jgi:hypothetical protein
MASAGPYGGETANYYNQQPGPPPNAYQMQPPHNGYYNGEQYQGQQYQPPPGPPPPTDPKNGEGYGGGYGAPQTFDQAFSVPKPKWNDLWAGILFLITCAGFVAVSGISIQGYGTAPQEGQKCFYLFTFDADTADPQRRHGGRTRVL